MSAAVAAVGAAWVVASVRPRSDGADDRGRLRKIGDIIPTLR